MFGKDVENCLLNDEYFLITARNFKEFKNSDEYEEKYKGRVLTELNEEFNDIFTINEENVMDIIKLLSNKNPQKGSLCYWGGLNDFKKYAEINLKGAADRLNRLLDENYDLEDRIRYFSEIDEESNEIFKDKYGKNWRIGLDALTYILAAKDYNKYPIYKATVYKSFLRSYTKSDESEDRVELYNDYLSLVDTLKSVFKVLFKEEASTLEIHSFLFLMGYNRKLKVNSMVEYLYRKAADLNRFKKDLAAFVLYVDTLTKEEIEYILKTYKDEENINITRNLFIDELFKKNNIIENSLENIKDMKNNMENLEDFNYFRVLFPFYNFNKDKRINYFLDEIIKILRQDIEELEDLETHKSDFKGEENLGNDRAWICFFDGTKKSHRYSSQLYLSIDGDKDLIEYGLLYGDKFKDKEKNDIERVGIEDFKYENLVNKFKNIYRNYNKNMESNLLDKERSLNVINDVDFNMDIDFKSIYFEEEVIMKNKIKYALKSGKSIILIGPPGTGKSKLAKAIVKSLRVDYKMVTAMSDWSSYDTIGGYKPSRENELVFDEGIFLSCFKNKHRKNINNWLIIDEINRADIDKAFGPFFSALSGDDINLGLKTNDGKDITIMLEKNNNDIEEKENIYIIPDNWRIIGTMNTFDKTSLYEMSYAFMRRFAFISVPIPNHIDSNLLKKYFLLWDINLGLIDRENITELWNIINNYRHIGPAIIEDISRYILQGGDYVSALEMYILPQLEGLFEDQLKTFVEDMIELEYIWDKKRLKLSVEDFFHIKIGD